MVENFKFIREEHYNCLENVLVSLLATWGREYILMFARNWGFSFLPAEDEKANILGSRIGGGEYRVWECLEEFCGVIPSFYNDENASRQINVLESELSQQRPVVLCLDGFYAPWKDVYGRYHFEHYSLAVSKDDSFVYCIDPFVNSIANALPIEGFHRGGAKCVTLRQHDRCRADMDWYGLMSEAARRMLRDEGDVNGVGGMRALADAMDGCFDIRKEIEGFEEMIWVSPIMLRVSDIGARRLHFAAVADSAGRACNEGELCRMAKQIEKAGWGWRRVRRMLAGACGSNSPEIFTHELAEEIRRLAHFEERTAQELLKCAAGHAGA